MTEIYTTKSAAALLEVNPKTVQRLCKSEVLKAHKKLGKWYILHSDLLKYIKG